MTTQEHLIVSRAVENLDVQTLRDMRARINWCNYSRPVMDSIIDLVRVKRVLKRVNGDCSKLDEELNTLLFKIGINDFPEDRTFYRGRGRPRNGDNRPSR